MLITPKFQPILPPIYFDGASIEWVQTIKYLGLTLDNKLTFNIHVNEICNKLSKFKGVFYSLSSLVPRSVLLNLYSAFVYPVLINNIIIWGGLNLTNGRRIQILLNKILRIILNVKYNNYIPLMDTTDMYKQLELLKFYDIYRYFLLRFYHFIVFDRIDVFVNNFSPLLPQRNYNTRNSRINLPEVSTDVERNLTIFQLCCLIRELPESFLTPQSKNTLKLNFRKFILDNY